MDKFIIAITGASGSIYGIRLLEALHKLEAETILTVSQTAQDVISYETDYSLDDVVKLATVYYEEGDLFAPIASGSYFVNIRAMCVVPCSMKTLSAIANGYSDNLITRAADMSLKEKKGLVLVPRETPFTLIHLKNMLTLTQSGAVILPPMPAFYSKPRTLEDIVQQTVGRMLDHLGIISDLAKRWRGVDG